MKCKFCEKEISFMDWLTLRRSCIDHWMEYYELPSMEAFMSQPKNKVKFEIWKDKKKMTQNL